MGCPTSKGGPLGAATFPSFHGPLVLGRRRAAVPACPRTGLGDPPAPIRSLGGGARPAPPGCARGAPAWSRDVHLPARLEGAVRPWTAAPPGNSDLAPRLFAQGRGARRAGTDAPTLGSCSNPARISGIPPQSRGLRRALTDVHEMSGGPRARHLRARSDREFARIGGGSGFPASVMESGGRPDRTLLARLSVPPPLVMRRATAAVAVVYSTRCGVPR